MLEYEIIRDNETKAYLVKGNILPGSIPVNIPNEDHIRKSYVSLFLHKADMESCLKYLAKISTDNEMIINEALFIAAITTLIKCFQSCESRTQLSEGKFKKSTAPEIYAEYERFKEWRNKHYAHDVNSMVEATAFLLVAPAGSPCTLGAPPSVIWNRVNIDYVKQRNSLKLVSEAVLRFIVTEIDRVGDVLFEKYSQKSYEELLSYGDAAIRAASLQNPEIARVGIKNT